MLNYADIKEKKIQSASSARAIQSRAGRSVFQFQDNRRGFFAGANIVQTYLTDNRPQSIIQKKLAHTLANWQPAYPGIQKKENKTGLPDNLKSGIENLSGLSMDDVKVHYRSDKPAQLNAHAYAQGADIHIAPGQEKHLQHEAWHVVQQKQGRVKPVMQWKGRVNINDDKALEKEADVMGEKAIQQKEAGFQHENNETRQNLIHDSFSTLPGGAGSSSIPFSFQFQQSATYRPIVAGMLPLQRKITEIPEGLYKGWWESSETPGKIYINREMAKEGEDDAIYRECIRKGKERFEKIDDKTEKPKSLMSPGNEDYSVVPAKLGSLNRKILDLQHRQQGFDPANPDEKRKKEQSNAISEDIKELEEALNKVPYDQDPEIPYFLSGHLKIPGSIYKNQIDVSKGILYADFNKRITGEKMPGSEILNRQYQYAINYYYRQQQKKKQIKGKIGAATEKEPQKHPLKKLVRRNVNSESGGPVHYKVLQTGKKVFKAEDGDDNFFAILGTENASSAFYLIKDHGEELGISGIDSVVLTDQGFEILFKTL